MILYNEKPLDEKRHEGVDFVMVIVFVLPLEQSSSFDFFPPSLHCEELSRWQWFDSTESLALGFLLWDPKCGDDTVPI